MDNILEQINNLTEQFSNLFEVEGLGDPASDVPPSTNKIKQDRKTKNGKVELVSVEDELFPYDGNKREQYRQKIIDTINNMIQGTATLEDLLQIVRQKKAPLKEAMEVLEELIGEEVSVETRKRAIEKIIDKDYKDTEPLWKKYEEGDREALKNIQRINQETDKKLDKYRKYAEYRKNKDSLKEAIEILENIHQAIEKYVKNPEKKEELHDKAFDNYVQDHVDQMNRIENKLKGVKKNSIEAYNKAFDIKKSHDINKNIKGATKTDTRAGIYRVAPDVDIDQDEFREQEKEYRRKKFNKSEGFEGAIEILTNLLEKHTEADKKEVANKVVNNRMMDFYDKYYELDTSDGTPTEGDMEELKRKEKRYKHAEKVANESFEGAIELLENLREQIDKKVKAGEINLDKALKLDKKIEDKMSPEKNAQEYSDELDKRAKKERLGDKAVTKSIRRNERKNANEGFEGAIEILEEIINEVSERTKIDAYKKRVAQHQELADRETKIANDYAKLGAYEPAINHLKKASDSQKKEFKHRLNTISHDKKFGQDAFNKAQKELYDEWKAKNNVKEGFEGVIEIIEDIHTAIEKRAHEIKKPMLHAKAIMNYSNELQKAAKKELPKNKKNSLKAINNKMNEIAKKRGISPVDNYVDGNKTDESFEGAIEILEEIINEVSLKKWKEAAKNSYDKRKEVADKSAEADKKSWDNYEKQSKLSPEDESGLFKKAVDQGAIAYKDKKRADHAIGVYANTPDSKHSATKYNKAILNSLKGREDKYVETGKKSDLDRAINTFHLAKLNPVKEAQELSELFDRPDLLDDISKALTNKTIKQHLENQAKKLLAGKKKKKVAGKACESFDSFEENRYNNVVKLLEEIISEVSNKKIKDSVTDRENLIDGAKELENLIRTDADKKLINDAIIRDQHRVEVIKDKLENRIVNKARAEYEEGKKKKKKEGE